MGVKMLCSTCPKSWCCIAACSEANNVCCGIDDDLLIRENMNTKKRRKWFNFEA